jgi:hypothetical protein
MNLVVERSTFYHIIIITNTTNGKEVIKLLGILLYNFAMESTNLKDNTHTHVKK